MLSWIATFGRSGELTPEVHWYLADLHFRLASEYKAIHHHVAARRHRKIANEHAAAGPPPEPRPAAAMAMPVPRPALFTDARGRQVPEPDDVA